VRAAVEWTEPAFEELTSLPEAVAFASVSHVDLLETFPEIGVSLGSSLRGLRGCRQLIVGRHYRVIYEFARDERLVYILAIQHCGQRLLTNRELRRRIDLRDSSPD
jgi:mRNA-degrading endonuclease RelE of RelBE toxin-antitoxin system